eukprot:14013307-Alexandrium_andersonii.AAC.1
MHVLRKREKCVLGKYGSLSAEESGSDESGHVPGGPSRQLSPGGQGPGPRWETALRRPEAP